MGVGGLVRLPCIVAVRGAASRQTWDHAWPSAAQGGETAPQYQRVGRCWKSSLGYLCVQHRRPRDGFVASRQMLEALCRMLFTSPPRVFEPLSPTYGLHKQF